MFKNNCSEIARSLLPLPPYNNSSNQSTDEVVARSAMVRPLLTSSEGSVREINPSGKLN